MSAAKQLKKEKEKNLKLILKHTQLYFKLLIYIYM